MIPSLFRFVPVKMRNATSAVCIAAICAVSQLPVQEKVAPDSAWTSYAALPAVYGISGVWTDSTSRMLLRNGFNGTGAWSSDGALQTAPQRLPYTKVHNFMLRPRPLTTMGVYR